MQRPTLIQEYRPEPGLVERLAAEAQASKEAVKAKLEAAANRVSAAVSNRDSGLDLTGGRVLAKGISGVIALDTETQLEICPKYASPLSPEWREDVLFMSLLANYGDLLPRDSIRLHRAGENDLSSFAGRVLVDLVSRNARHPLRVHKKLVFESFVLEGAVEPEDFVFPTEAGYRQTALRFTGNNGHAAVLRDALRLLHPRVKDGALRSELSLAEAKLGQITVSRDAARLRLRQRLSHWQDAYDLAFALVSGAGLKPGQQGTFRGPGFVIDTWRTWEQVMSRALLTGFGYSNVELQNPSYLGASIKNGLSTAVKVKPDAVVKMGCERVIVDAKYKGRADKGFGGITEEDLYEALAFCQSCGVEKAILCYPATPDFMGATGEAQVPEVIYVGSRCITAICIQLNGIAARGGYSAFINGLAQQVTAVTR